MPPLPSDWQATLRAAGGDALSRRAALLLAGRLTRYGYIPEAHNFGRLLCRLPLPHVHGQADADNELRCMLWRGEYVRRWRSDLEGMARLAAIAARGPGSPALASELAGFRSVFPEGGGTPEHDVGGVVDILEDVALLSNPVTAPFGVAKIAYDRATAPTEEAEHAFQLLAADWLQFEAAGVPLPPWQFLTGQHDAWIAFRDAWTSGKPDTTNLQAMSIDADTVRKYLAEKDPKWNEVKPVHVPDVTQSTGTLIAAQAVSDKAKQAEAAASSATSDLWTKIPLSVKLGGAGVVLAAVLGSRLLPRL